MRRPQAVCVPHNRPKECQNGTWLANWPELIFSIRAQRDTQKKFRFGGGGGGHLPQKSTVPSAVGALLAWVPCPACYWSAKGQLPVCRERVWVDPACVDPEEKVYVKFMGQAGVFPVL